jgi:hypothetical protein
MSLFLFDKEVINKSKYSSTLIERFCASLAEFQANRAVCFG